MKSYTSELAFAQKMASEAGKIMKRYFRSQDIDTEWKADHTPLTIADKKINDLLIEQVEKHYPDHGVIGEEDSYMEERDMVWVVDPIDGTAPYSLGIPTSTFCLALVDRKDGQPVIAVVYDPFLDHLYTATRGEGAYLNGKKLKASSVENFHHSYLAVNGFVKKVENGKVLIRPGKLMERIRQSHGGKCLTFQSHVYTAMKVASGELVGSVLAFGSPWDAAAASLIVEEAGGLATDLNGKKRRYDEFANGTVVAANSKILDILIYEIKKSAEDK
ncbi:MAG TPA: inositol monophosphatase [Candidatus Saccharimonadales bacterium]|nr:inositol monophosphatase [Candidatus Saccharimonadales bacterium]